VLGQFLQIPFNHLAKAILDERAKKTETIHCFSKNNTLTSEAIDHWLAKAGY